MGNFSTAGKIVIALGVFGFLVGLYEAARLYSITENGEFGPYAPYSASAEAVLLSAIITLGASIYIGYMGLKIDELDNSSNYDEILELKKRITALERQGKTAS